MFRLWGMLAGSLLVLSSLHVGAAAESGKTWMLYGGDAANTRFSPLSQINRSNVAKLKVAWVAQLGSLEAQESTPLVVGDTLFVTTSSGPRAVGHRLKLLDAIALLRADGSVKAPPAEASSILPKPAQDTAERRQVTVMFSDLVGSTALYTYGPWRIRPHLGLGWWK